MESDLLTWLKKFSSSRVFHVSGLDSAIKIFEQDHLPGETRSLRKMSEAEIRAWVQSRNRVKNPRNEPRKGPQGRKPKPADDLQKAIEKFLNVWKRAKTALPRTASGPVENLVAIRPAVKKLAAVTRKLKRMVGLRIGGSGGGQ